MSGAELSSAETAAPKRTLPRKYVWYFKKIPVRVVYKAFRHVETFYPT